MVGPGQLTAVRPAKVLLFLADLMTEARDAFPEVEASGGQWVNIDWLSLGCRMGRVATRHRAEIEPMLPTGVQLAKPRAARPRRNASQPAPSSELVLAASD